jgi:hypothetical protein
LQQQTTNHISHETLTCTNPIKNQKKNAQHSSLEDTQLISSLHLAKLFDWNFFFSPFLFLFPFLPASLSDQHKKLFSYSKCNRSTRLAEQHSLSEEEDNSVLLPPPPPKPVTKHSKPQQLYPPSAWKTDCR